MGAITLCGPGYHSMSSRSSVIDCDRCGPRPSSTRPSADSPTPANDGYFSIDAYAI